MKRFRDIVNGVPRVEPLRLFDTVSKEDIYFDETELRYLLLSIMKGAIPRDRFRLLIVEAGTDKEWLKPIVDDDGECIAQRYSNVLSVNRFLTLELIKEKRKRESCQ